MEDAVFGKKTNAEHVIGCWLSVVGKPKTKSSAEDAEERRKTKAGQIDNFEPSHCYFGFQLERSQSGMAIQMVRADAAIAVRRRMRRFMVCRPLKRAALNLRSNPTAYAVG